MMEAATVRMLVQKHPEIADFDFKWIESPSFAHLDSVLAEYGYRLAAADRDIAGEYNDIKAYYGCSLVPLEVDI